MENVDPIPQVRTTYMKSHPPLTPLDSQENDHPAAAINVGDEILDEHIMAASHQHNHRKALLKSNHATPREVMASKKRKTGLLIESISPVPIGPDWAQAILQGMDRIDRRLDRIDRIDRSLIQLSIQTARNTNRSHTADEPITPVQNGIGALPRAGLFPEFVRDITSMPLRDVDELLDFYEIVPERRANLNQKKSCLFSYLGFTQLAGAF